MKYIHFDAWSFWVVLCVYIIQPEMNLKAAVLLKVKVDSLERSREGRWEYEYLKVKGK